MLSTQWEYRQAEGTDGVKFNALSNNCILQHNRKVTQVDDVSCLTYKQSFSIIFIISSLDFNMRSVFLKDNVCSKFGFS